jgi:hypothetical protein
METAKTYPNINLPSSMIENMLTVAPRANIDAPRTHINENKKRPTEANTYS